MLQQAGAPASGCHSRCLNDVCRVARQCRASPAVAISRCPVAPRDAPQAASDGAGRRRTGDPTATVLPRGSTLGASGSRPAPHRAAGSSHAARAAAGSTAPSVCRAHMNSQTRHSNARCLTECLDPFQTALRANRTPSRNPSRPWQRSAARRFRHAAWSRKVTARWACTIMDVVFHGI